MNQAISDYRITQLLIKLKQRLHLINSNCNIHLLGIQSTKKTTKKREPKKKVKQRITSSFTGKASKVADVVIVNLKARAAVEALGHSVNQNLDNCRKRKKRSADPLSYGQRAQTLQNEINNR